MAVIYGLVCSINGKVYVGCTAGKLAKRFREHRCLLNKGKHSEADLLNDWRAHGSAAFDIAVLEVLPEGAEVALKRARETHWMDWHANRGLLYNRNRQSYQFSPDNWAKGVEASRGVPGNRWTPEANRKRSLAQLGKPKGHGAKISATKRAKRAQMDEIV